MLLLYTKSYSESISLSYLYKPYFITISEYLAYSDILCKFMLNKSIQKTLHLREHRDAVFFAFIEEKNRILYKIAFVCKYNDG